MITVEEIKKLAPLAEVVSLDPDATHIICIDTHSAPLSIVDELRKALRHYNIKAVFIRHAPGENPLSIFEIK